MTHDYKAALDAILNYKQADEDGIMVLTSRQAIHEVVDYVRELAAEHERVKKERDELARLVRQLVIEGCWDDESWVFARKVSNENEIR